MPNAIIDAELVSTRQPLHARWEAIDNAREQIAAELDLMTHDFSGESKFQLRALGDWFRNDASYDSALLRSDVLAICLPLVLNQPKNLTERNQDPDAGELTDPITLTEIVQATRVGFCRLIPRPQSAARHLVSMLIYPLMILLAAWVLWIAFSFWLAPQFEEMLNDFEITLPTVTLTLFRMSRFVRRWWWLMAGAPFLSLAVLWFFGRATVPHRVGEGTNFSYLMDNWLMGKRQALAIWAWHLSMLLEAGVAESRAIGIAGSVSKKPWLRRAAFDWNQRQTADSNHRTARSVSTSPVRLPFRLSPTGRYELLNSVMAMPISLGKIAMLRETSTFYWERSRSMGDWWIRWLATLILWFVGGMVLLVALALFVPLISIIGALAFGGRVWW